MQCVWVIIVPWNNFMRTMLTHFISFKMCVFSDVTMNVVWISHCRTHCWRVFEALTMTFMLIRPKMVLSGTAAFEFGGKGREHSGSVVWNAKKTCQSEHLWFKPSRAFTAKTETCGPPGTLLSYQEYSPPKYHMSAGIFCYISGLNISTSASGK